MISARRNFILELLIYKYLLRIYNSFISILWKRVGISIKKALALNNFQIKYNTDLTDIFYGLNPKCLIICDEEKILKYQEK